MNTPFTKPSYVLHMDVKRAPVEQVAAGTIPFSSATTGFLSGVVNLSGEGLPSPKPNDSLRGLIEGTLEDGTFKLTPTLVAVARALGINQSSEIPLTKVVHTVRIQGTKMLIDKANGDLGEDKAEMNGWVGLAGQGEHGSGQARPVRPRPRGAAPGRPQDHGSGPGAQDHHQHRGASPERVEADDQRSR